MTFDRTKHSTVKCPTCNFTGNVADFKELDENKTETPADKKSNQDKMYKPGKLLFLQSDVPWESTDKQITLQRGENILGRISLPIKDKLMSRQHIVIDVVYKPDSVFAHHLKDNNSKNGTFHNGDRLEQEDVIILLPNDIVQMGHTTFKFVADV